MYDLTVVIPTHNEERFIGQIIQDVGKTVSKSFKNYIIAVADGASTDSTANIVLKMAAKDHRVMLVKYEKRGQRGADALNTMIKYKANLYFYIDADLAPSIKYLPQALGLEREGCDMVLGSRYESTSKTERPPLRMMVSKVYNKMLNMLFNEQITDHQCGFRIFDKKASDLIVAKSREKHWMWDTEVILLALANNLKVCEMPILWIERHTKRTPLKRLIGDIKIHGLGILRLFWRFRISRQS